MTKVELAKHLRREHSGIVRNFGQHFNRATKRDLEVAHEAWHNANDRFVSRGREAFEAGEMRIVPRAILVENGTTAAEAWYRGWDRANLAAPVPD